MLDMINSFIFTGEFEDPFNEFFVVKLLSRQSGKCIGYRIRGDFAKTVPTFLKHLAVQIYRCGGSVNLLAGHSGRYKEGYGQELCDYLKICSGYTQKGLIHSYLPRRLVMVYELDDLKRLKDSFEEFQDTQVKQLKQIEERIVVQEEQHYKRSILLLEQAKQAKQLEFERQKQKEEDEEIERRAQLRADLNKQI